MPALDHVQSAMMQALDHGPDHLPAGLFAGSAAQILSGMKVHANTISHARLVALEDTFPRTLALMGHDQFNEHSRLYLEHPGVTARILARIGEGFVAWLDSCGEANSEWGRAAVDLARFEWHWLKAYHAGDAPPLRLADLAGIDTDTLMDIPVRAHPAASAGVFDSTVHTALREEVPGIADAQAILLTRPDAEVLVSPASAAMCTIFGLAQKSATIGNLLASCSEPDCKDRVSAGDFMPALIALLEAGALIRTDKERVT